MHLRILTVILLLILPGSHYAYSETRDYRPIYRFGVTPWQQGQSEDDIRSLYKPMLIWLGEKVGVDFLIVTARDYNQMVELMAYEMIELGSISPIPFVLAKTINPSIEMLVTELSDDLLEGGITAHYQALIVTRKDNSEVNDIYDLKGKRFGFVSNQSTSGYVYPMAYLRKQGVDANKYFDKVYYLGSHPRLTDAVAANSLDAGATWDYNLKQAQEKHGDIFKVLAVTGEIPNLGIAINSQVSETLKQLIRSALLEIDPGLLQGMPAGGYVIKDDSYYDPVREVLRSIGIHRLPYTDLVE
jgi:phosphonate transport system substrate-binding protein